MRGPHAAQPLDSFETYLFWSSALLAGLLAIGFFVKGRGAANPDLAWRQTKDNWMLCAILWAVLLGHTSPARPALLMAGTTAQWWLAWRTVRRIGASPRITGCPTPSPFCVPRD
jgi:hypothetical protein